MPTARTRRLVSSLARPLLLASLLVVGLPPVASAAATGPTVVDDVAEVSVGLKDAWLPGETDDLAGSAPLRPELTVFPADQLASLPPDSKIAPDGRSLLYGNLAHLGISTTGKFDFQPLRPGHLVVRYRITDAAGLSDDGLLDVTITAGGNDDRVETVQARPATIDPLENDTPGRNADGTPGTLDPTSVRFTAQQPATSVVTEDGRVATLPDIGTFTIDATTGRLTFSPDPDYVADVPDEHLVYSARDTTRAADGTVAHHAYTSLITWSVSAVRRLVVTHTVDPKTFDHVGQVITWTAKVTNVGPSVVDDLALTESSARISARTCTPVPVGGTLARGASTTCTATSTVEQRDLDAEIPLQADTVTASGTTLQDGHRIETHDLAGTQSSGVVSQGLRISTFTSPATVSRVGQFVDFAFLVQNTGNVSLHDLMVRAPIPGLHDVTCGPVPEGGTLGDSESTACSALKVATAADLSGSTFSGTVKATARPIGSSHAKASNAVATVGFTVAAQPPQATPDTVGAVDGGPDVVLPASTNDAPGIAGGPAIDPTRTVLVVGRDQETVGQQYTTAQGRWTVLPDGSVRFRPGFDHPGEMATIGYRVYDAAGRSSVGLLEVPIRPGPRAAEHSVDTDQGQPVTVDVLADDDPGQNADGTPSAFDRSTVQVALITGSHLYPTSYALDQRTAAVFGVGRYAVTGDGSVTFTPDPRAYGEAPTLVYSARTASGVTMRGTLAIDVNRNGPINPPSSGPVAIDDEAETTTQLPVPLPAQDNDVGGPAGFGSSRPVFLPDNLAALPRGSTLSSDQRKLTVAGQGVFAVEAGQADVIFTPTNGFVGTTDPVAYQITDTAGAHARANLQVRVLAGSVARGDVAVIRQNQTVTVDVLANDDLGPSPVGGGVTRTDGYPRLTTRGLPGATVSADGQTLSVPDVGAYRVDPGTGAVTFDPVTGFLGTTTVSLDLRNTVERPRLVPATVSLTSSLRITVSADQPVANPDEGISYGRPVLVRALANDKPGSGRSPLVGSSVRLRLTPTLQAAGAVLWGDAKVLVVPDRGFFLVSPQGEITFAPTRAKPTRLTVGYQVADTNGTTARSTVTVTQR